MVFLQGAARPTGPAAACLELVQNEYVQLFLSSEMLEEIRDVLTRPKLQRKFPILTPDYVDSFLEALSDKAIHLDEIPQIFRYERDPKDEKVINLALAAEVTLVVSRDNDLLDLMDETRPEGQDFRQRFPKLTIVDPVTFLQTLAARIETEAE